jgi:ATP phosphoribosyltransferase regulatory subunit
MGRFRYPTGARPLLIEETARRRGIESRFVSLLESEGFAEVVLPIIDFAEPYAPVTRREAARQSYRFTDRDGELVAVRSDFTPMLARALGPVLDDGDLPLRVFYRGDVIRCQATRLGANRELFQIGAEIIGDPSPEADVAVLRLVAGITRSFGIEPLIVYTDASILQPFDGDTRAALLTKRMSANLPPLAQKLIAGTATLDDVHSERLEIVARTLGDDARFVLHLDDVEPDAGYYSGLRFRVFAADRRTLIAQGGRYDTLYGHFGIDAPAIGFTFTIDELEAAPLARRTAGQRPALQEPS